MPPPHPCRLLCLACLLLATGPAAFADPRVAVVAKADPAYTARKFGDGKAAVETYVVMQGHYFDGLTVDHSIERMPFRQIAEYLGVELARENYLPAKTIKDAQLLIVVHWGTTIPRLAVQEAFGGTNLTSPVTGAADIAAFAKEHPTGTFEDGLPPAPDTTQTPEANDLPGVADRLIGSMTQGNAVTLLGYNEELYRLRKNLWSGTKEAVLNDHLTHERYFITLFAYDLREESTPGRTRKPLWSVHLNISSPGNNFNTALTRISSVAVNFAGRTTDGMETVRPTEREGKVTLGEMVILGEVKLK
jgi:hypothetical protein